MYPLSSPAEGINTMFTKAANFQPATRPRRGTEAPIGPRPRWPDPRPPLRASPQE